MPKQGSPPLLTFSKSGQKLIVQNAPRPETLVHPEVEFLSGGYKWSGLDNGWAFPKTFHTALLLASIYSQPQITINHDVKTWVNRQRQQRVVSEFSHPGANAVWSALRPYQWKGAAFLTTRPAALLADSVGLGKTIQAIAPASVRHPATRLVICPNSLKLWWRDQIAEYLPGVLILTAGQGRDALPNLSGDGGTIDNCWVIVHWEAIRMERNLGVLRRTYWDFIIADEAHRIKNPKTQTAKALKSLRARQRWALTATPYANIPADLFSILQWLRPAIYTSYWKFYALYTHYVPNDWGRTSLGPKNESLLAWELRDIMLRREPQQVFKDIPPTTRTILPVTLEGEQLASYNLARKEVLFTLADGSELSIPNAVARTVRLRQITTDPELVGMCGASAKLAAVRTLLDMSPDPVVIFTTFRSTAGKIAELICPRGGARYSLYIGGSPQDEITRFQEGHTNVLVGTIAAMREGLNLQRARRAIFVDLPWSQIEWVQASGRIRPGLPGLDPSEIIIIEARDTIDRTIRRVLEGKVAGAQAIYDALKEALSG